MNKLTCLLTCIVFTTVLSCGKTIVRTYDSDSWNKEFHALTTDSSGLCYLSFTNRDHKIKAQLNYSSSYQTANELLFVDFDIVVEGEKLEPSKEKYRTDDSDYKLIIGYQNTIYLKKEEWKDLGTQLKIDTVKNDYLGFRVIINKTYKIKGDYPKEITLMLHTKTKSGIKDTSVVMYYDQYEDHSAPFRFH